MFIKKINFGLFVYKLNIVPVSKNLNLRTKLIYEIIKRF